MFETKKTSPMKIGGLYFVFAATLLTVSCRAQSKADAVPPTRSNSAVVKPTPEPVKTVSKIKFSSVYKKLDSKSCQPISKSESETDETPLICEGYKGYKIFVAEHGVLPRIYIGREISTNLDSWETSDFPSFVQNSEGGDQTIEWRLADGEPFAVIVRAVYDKQFINPDDKGTVNNLNVRNLKGFAPIEASIDARENKRANEEARKLADAAYGKL